MKKETDHRSYWLGDVFFCDGYAWAVEEREIANDYSEVGPLCLGGEAEVVPILRRDKPITGDMHARRRAILQKILEASQNGREVTTSHLRGPSYLRTKAVRNTRHRAKSIGRPASRKRLPMRLSR